MRTNVIFKLCTFVFTACFESSIRFGACRETTRASYYPLIRHTAISFTAYRHSLECKQSAGARQMQHGVEPRQGPGTTP
ncbi:hypothetical protein GGR52DRAFT_543195 [Hypoxylon sp. FL1284]|nr:hypothetical protein GGR52DRAFT_543195 [Hypoxylon sp. FL1284]